MNTEHDYDYWRARLAGQDLLGSDDLPRCGFWRRLDRASGQFVAVAVWRDGDSGELLATNHDGRRLWTVEAEDACQYAWKYPITHEAYQAFTTTGRWPDGLPEGVEPAAYAKPAGIGHNAPAADDAAIIADQVEAAKAAAARVAKIEDDEALAVAQSLRSRLLELKSEAEKKHTAEKAPHLKAGRDVDAKWLPLAKDAKAAADGVRAKMDEWETAKLRREREEQRKAEEARRAAEEAARAAEAAGRPSPAPSPEPAPAPAPAPPAQIKGAYGRTASVRMVKVVAEITDIDALLLWLKAHPEMIELAKRLAQRAVDKGIEDVPGVTVEDRRKVA